MRDTENMSMNDRAENLKVRIFMLVPPQIHLLDINGPAHIFFEAREMGADIQLHYITATEQKDVTSSAGLTFSQLESFSQYTLDHHDWLTGETNPI